METVIATLQDEIPELPNLQPDTENTLLLAIAGLKQVMYTHINLVQVLYVGQNGTLFFSCKMTLT